MLTFRPKLVVGTKSPRIPSPSFFQLSLLFSPLRSRVHFCRFFPNPDLGCKHVWLIEPGSRYSLPMT